MSLQKNAGAVRAFALAMRFGNWLQALPGKMMPAPFRLMQISSGFWLSRALYVAARLDIAEVLGDDELTAAAVAVRVGADADAVARLLRFLASHGVFNQCAPDRFRNSRLSDCLRAERPGNVRSVVLMHNSPEMSRPWFEQLERGVRAGVPPFRLAHGEDLFDHLDRHGEFDALFSQAMDSVEALTGTGFATDFDWSRFARIVDVGGSRGSKALAIMRHHPALTALVFDRPQVVAEAQAHWHSYPVAGSERLRFLGGDMRVAIPPAGDDRDIFLLAAVLHGFDDAISVAVLKNLVAAVGDTGARAALLEMVLPEGGGDPVGAAFDMQMFMATRGRERTLRQWQALFTAAGLALEEVVGLRGVGSLLILHAG